MKNVIREEIKEIRGILGRIKRRDLKGNSGQAIKNSSWQFATTMVAKIGSLLFTIIIARLMMPELYGLYGLALSTILFFGIFNNMGLTLAMRTFLSKNIDKLPGKAKGYFKYLTKWKIALSVLSVILILLLSKWIATGYYQKPIYYALLAGMIYLPIITLHAHLKPIFSSTNNFKPLLIKEIILQILKLTIIPLSIIFFLSKISSQGVYLFYIFIILSLCYFIAFLYMFWRIKKKQPFQQAKAKNLTPEEKRGLRKFILPLTVTSLSGIFFGYIDQIMLGHYVESAFLGFYQAAFNLAISAAMIVAFSGAAMFPILARLKGGKLERGFKKSRNITATVSILAAIFTIILSPLIIRIIYGPMYLMSIGYLRILSISIITYPLIALYTTFYTSQMRTRILSGLLIFSTILNIALNYLFINIGLQYSMSYAVMGACIATIISRSGYLGGLILFRKWKNK